MKLLMLTILLSSGVSMPVLGGHEVGGNGDKLCSWFRSVCEDMFQKIELAQRNHGPASEFGNTNAFRGSSVVVSDNEFFMTDDFGQLREVIVWDKTIYLWKPFWQDLYDRKLPDYRLAYYASLSVIINSGEAYHQAMKLKMFQLTNAPYSDRMLEISKNPPRTKRRDTSVTAIKAWYRSVCEELVSKHLEIARDNPLLKEIDTRRLQSAVQSDALAFDAKLWSNLAYKRTPDYRFAYHNLLLAADYDDKNYRYSSQLLMRRFVNTPYVDSLVGSGLVAKPTTDSRDPNVPEDTDEGAKQIKSWFQQSSIKLIAKWIEMDRQLVRNGYQRDRVIEDVIPERLQDTPYSTTKVIGPSNDDFFLNEIGERKDVVVLFTNDQPTIYLRRTTWEEQMVSKRPDYRLILHALLYSADYDDRLYKYSSQLPADFAP